jgi:uncharacterized protein YjbI with pentapeptide repeats
MANPEHLAILKQGVKEWNKWRTEHPGVLYPDLCETDLIKADLHWANLSRARLSGANLMGADLTRAHLIEANLRSADVRDANLAGAILSEADLGGANLLRANLREANLGGANLSETNLYRTDLCGAYFGGADFTLATTGGTGFSDVDLSTTKGLESLVHRGPSTVGIDTIYKSLGKIPEVFLRGCGVPDEFIAYIGSMVGRPIEFYSCFISYSTKDQEFAERLHADLQAKGVRCWFAPEEMKAGRKLHEQIDEAIRLHDKLLLILSEHSMSSNWVKTEIANAREREKREGKQLLFPITLVPFEAIKPWKLFDADIGIDSAREIREYFIPDFSNWKDHDSYQTAFQHLVKDLKAGASG